MDELVVTLIDHGSEINLMSKDFYMKKRILEDNEKIIGIYEQNGLEDPLKLMASIGLGNDDKIISIHLREVYDMIESFQVPEIIVEIKYKTVNKKIKPVARPLPENSKEQIREVLRKKSLKNPRNIGHKFTKETFEELKISSNGSMNKVKKYLDANYLDLIKGIYTLFLYKIYYKWP
uniref:Uncharacterized protein n=1 Tax=Physcomitrium patens TaxID=3218 RepID=A0A2K1IYC6_PHYPA|nr:hypothetical protein PHYPA_024096 [Physcomitrium patens]